MVVVLLLMMIIIMMMSVMTMMTTATLRPTDDTHCSSTRRHARTSLLPVDVQSSTSVPGITLVLAFDSKRFRRKSLSVPSAHLLNMLVLQQATSTVFPFTFLVLTVLSCGKLASNRMYRDSCSFEAHDNRSVVNQ